MQSEPTWEPFFATAEQRDQWVSDFRAEYGNYVHSTDGHSNICACGNYIGRFDHGIRIRSYTSEYGWYPQICHSIERCYLSEADLQAECQGPTRKLTGTYVGCTNCESYVRLAETRDSAYVYGVQFNDFNMEVFDGDKKLEGVMEVKVGVGGYIIQVRATPETHFCPCYLAEPDDDTIDAKVCRAYIPGNNFRVEEKPEAS